MTQLIKDAAISKLAAPIGAADTSLTVNISEADLFPPANTGTDPVNTVGKDWFKLVLEDINHNREVIYVRTRTLGSATMSNLLRGQEGTTAISFASGSTSGYLSVTSQDMQATIDLAAQATAQGKLVLNAATPEAQAQALGAGLQKQSATAFTTAGTATAYTLTPTPAVTAYVANLSFDVTFHLASGDNPTFQISGLVTPPNLVKQTANGSYSNISASDITANHRSRVKLLSATQALVENLPVVDAKQLQTQAATAFTSTGTAPTYVITTDPAITALVAGKTRRNVTFHAGNGGAASTLNTNGLGAVGLKQYDSAGAKVDPIIVAGMIADVEYDGTHEVILDPLPTASGLSAASTTEAQAGTSNTVAITPLRMREGLNASGNAPVYACRAWVNFNGTGTPAIRAAGNVSSITDNGVGDYTVNFTTALADSNSCVQVTSHRGDGAGANPGYSGVWPTAGNAYTSISATNVRVQINDSATAAQDKPYVGVAIFR